MSIDPKLQRQQQQPVPAERIKVIGFKVTERELQNTIYPIMRDCYQLGIIDYDIPCDIVSTVFCIQFWIGHYRMKKQQFDLSHQEIEQEEKKKLATIAAEKEAYERSTRHVIQQATKKLKKWENSSRGTSKKPIRHYSNQKTGQSQSNSSPRFFTSVTKRRTKIHG
jgi:hypothetical protein